MSHKILVVDDERIILNSITAYLAREGFIIETATDGKSALQAARAFRPDLVVLDIMLPQVDGLEVLRQLRQESDVYVILLSARADEADKVIGLGLGADDYVTKPFSPRELAARVKAAFRRLDGRAKGDNVLVFHRLRLETESRQVFKDDEFLDLTPIEFDLLHTLMRHAGRVLSREQLLEQVWGYNYFGEERTVDVHIGRLRRKIEDDPTNPTMIITVWAAGYRFEAEPT